MKPRKCDHPLTRSTQLYRSAAAEAEAILKERVGLKVVEDTIKIATINMGGVDIEVVIKAIKVWDAEIICIQETHVKVSIVRKALREVGYDVVGEDPVMRKDKHEHGMAGVVIASRIPIIGQPHYATAKKWRIVAGAFGGDRKEPLVVTNFYLHANNADREERLEIVRDAVTTNRTLGRPSVPIGDWNQIAGDETVVMAEAAGYRYVDDDVGSDEATRKDDFRKSWRHIDFAMATEDVHIKGRTMDKHTEVADHYGVLYEVVYAGTPKVLEEEKARGNT